MQDMCAEQIALAAHQTKAVQIVDRYWHQLAAGGQLPKRASIDPREIQDALEYAFIAEHLAAGHAKLRVAGGSVNAVMGMQVAGMPMAVLVCPKDRDRFTAQLRRVFDDTVKMTITLAAPARFGQPQLEATLRVYPLRDAYGQCRQLIGTFVTNGMIGRTPRRFGVTAVAATAITSPTPTYDAAHATRGHLKLVVSNA